MRRVVRRSSVVSSFFSSRASARLTPDAVWSSLRGGGGDRAAVHHGGEGLQFFEGGFHGGPVGWVVLDC